MSKHFWAGLVLGLDLSPGWTCVGVQVVWGPDLSKNFRPEVSKIFRAGCVLRSEVSKSVVPEVSRSLTWITAGSALELQNAPLTYYLW